MLFDGEGIALLIEEDANLVREILLMGEIDQSLDALCDSPLTPGFPKKVSGQCTPRGSNKAILKEGTLLVKMVIQRV